MPQATEKRILIPADAPERGALETALRGNGWVPLTYASVREAEHALAHTPAAVVLLNAHGENRVAHLVKTVRRLCPDAFVVGMGEGPGEATTDAVLRATSTPEEIAAAIQVGAAMQQTRANERALREQLRAIEEQTRGQAQRIQELETLCTSLRAVARSAQELAVRDELTSLYNRRYFIETAEIEIDRARRENTRFALAMIDIDHFKHFNDIYGHVTGDQILRHFGRVLIKNLRRMDTVARYGGEEFVMLMPETRKAREAEFNPPRLMERLRHAIETDTYLNGSNKFDAPITISAGVVVFPADAKTVPHLILEADARLFRAKESGRNRVVSTGEPTAI